MCFRSRFVASAAALALGMPLAAETATKLKDFEGIEEPEVRCLAATGKFERDAFVNIRDAGDGAVRMTLRFSAEWWDGDRKAEDKSRQRAEVKGLGPHQKIGERFEYATTWRTDPNFHGADKFCHVFQVKATNGDSGAPLIVLSVLENGDTAAVRYWSGNQQTFSVARKFPWKPNTWQNVRMRIRTSAAGASDGEVLVSVDGDEFQGVTGIPLFRPEADDYRPKWGLYRGTTPKLPAGESWVEHKHAVARKL